MSVNSEITNAWATSEAAFEQLFKALYAPLCRKAAALLNDTVEAEEIVQQVFVSMWEKRNDLKIKESIQAYLFTTVRNASLNRIRFNQVRMTYSATQSRDKMYQEPMHAWSEKELQNEIAKAIELLPEQCRLVFKLSRFESMKYAEIAATLGISVKTVENQMGKALKILREKLKDYLVLLAAVIFQYIN